jgi:hypothetical protein
VTFGIEFQGKETEVIALVSSSIEGEVLLSWQVLQKLGVIKSHFPNIEERAAVVDLVQLNKFVDRPTHPFPAPKDIIASIPKGSKCFAVFDAANGYWQIPLEEES